MDASTLIRRVIFRPYRGGMGPCFTLQIHDENLPRKYNKVQLSYQLRETGIRTPLFRGTEYGCSPMHATDSDGCVEALMSFLTLKPGDTDKEYFNDHTERQLDFCSSHAEALAIEVMNRFGKEN